jgi:hypothetical protein
MILASASFAANFDFGLGANWSSLRTHYRYPMASMEFTVNNLDIQFDWLAFATPVESYKADNTLEYATTHVLLQDALSLGYIVKPWDNGNRFGIGLTSYTFYSDDINECQGEFFQSFRLYYKWSYFFDSGWEICAKNFIVLYGFLNEKYETTGNKWNRGGDWFFYFDEGGFYELGTWWTLVVPVLEVRYHF